MPRIHASILKLPLPMLCLAATMTLFPHHLQASEHQSFETESFEVHTVLRDLFQKKGFDVLQMRDTGEGILLTAQHAEEVYTFAIDRELQVLRVEPGK